jgi:hypothetical protein
MHQGARQMKVLELGRYALCISMAAAMLAGCGSQAPIAAMPQSAAQSLPFAQRNAIGQHDRSGSSWMAPDAVTQDLLYVGGNSGDVTVYSYPRGRLLGTLTGFYLPAGECVDGVGDVFITDMGLGKIFEYRHGGKKPIQTLQAAANAPAGCAVDPTTGNLAVTSLGGGGSGGNVAIYPHAQGTPMTYTDPNIYYYYWCGYDPKGNLYVDGQAYAPETFELAELPHGSNTFTNITLNQTINWPGGVQWDGKYVAVGDQAARAIYQFTISGSNGTVEGTTNLNHATDVHQFWIQGRVVIGGNHSLNNVQYWPYPAGGNPTKTITKGVGGPVGMTVSLAPGAKSRSMHNAKKRSR